MYLCAAIRQHHGGSLDSDRQLQLAAVRAILNGPPLEFLRSLAQDSKVQDCAVISEKRKRKKVLREIKAEAAAAARKDPMTMLKATVEHSSPACTIKLYREMQSIFNKSGFRHCLPSDRAMAAAKNGLRG